MTITLEAPVTRTKPPVAIGSTEWATGRPCCPGHAHGCITADGEHTWDDDPAGIHTCSTCGDVCDNGDATREAPGYDGAPITRAEVTTPRDLP